MNRRKITEKIFSAAIRAVDPYNSVIGFKDTVTEIFSGGKYKKVHVIGFGKAACPMAKAAEEIFDIDSGVIVTKYGHCSDRYRPERIKIYEAGHPVPDKNGLAATERILDLAKASDRDTFTLCLISGGGSALLVSPLEGITLDEKRAVTEILLRAGADIHEMNTVRKHVSAVKGGRLALALDPARTVSLILSDVVGDKLDVIASGPTSPDTSSYKDAMRIFRKYGLEYKVPGSVRRNIERGIAGEIPETPKVGDSVFTGVDNIIVGSNRKALEAARAEAEAAGFDVQISTSELTGEASEVGKMLAETALIRSSDKKGPTCLISGGETTVTVKGNGKGGRNTELALAFAIAIAGRKGITLLSAGTDGNDGPTDAAGAVVDGESIRKARDLGLDPGEYLRNNDSYTFFKKTGDILITGPTGTNVMDVQIIIVE